MVQSQLEKLEGMMDRIEDNDQIDAAELRDIAEDLETGKKYKCATCQMFCTGEDVMVIFNTETQEFIQIEVPMDENEDVVVTRVN